MTEEEIYTFVQTSIGSVWALELLLFLRRGDERVWSAAELVRELRSSDTAVADCLGKLVDLGAIARSEAGYQYRPSSSQIATAVDELQRLYSAKPISVMKAIMTAPNEKLRIFSNAFRLKD